MRVECVLAAIAAIASQATADISGFNNLSGWTYNQSDGGTPADLPSADTVHLTNLGTSQSRSLFHNTAQDISRFSVSFTYRVANASNLTGCGYGATFTLSADPDGPGSLGSTGSGLGYRGISPSVAVGFYINSNSTGVFTGGVTGSTNGLGPVNLRSNHDLAVTLDYNGSILSQSVLDTVTGELFTRNYIVGDLAGILGSDHAYIGFTASTTTGACSGSAANQYFSGFEFASVPAPGTGMLLASGLLITARRRR